MRSVAGSGLWPILPAIHLLHAKGLSSLIPLDNTDTPTAGSYLKLSRGSVMAARQAHNLEAAGSTPAPAIMGPRRDGA